MELQATGVVPNTDFLNGSPLQGKLNSSGYLTNNSMRVMEQVYAIGDVREKPAAEVLASYAHWEANYVAECIRCHVAARSQPKPYTPPGRMCLVSLGGSDGVLVYDDWVVLWGRGVPILKWMVKMAAMNFWLPPLGLSLWIPRLNHRYKPEQRDAGERTRPGLTSQVVIKRTLAVLTMASVVILQRQIRVQNMFGIML